MRSKRTIAYILMSITFLLNVIPLIPHHHHYNDITSICLFSENDDSDICSPINPKNKTPFSNTQCADCCKTNLTILKVDDSDQQSRAISFDFNTIIPQVNYDFTTPCLVLKTKSYQYKQQLFTSPTHTPYILRGPPSLTFS